MKYIQYGKVFPPSMEVLDKDFSKAYIWLSKYCGFLPQIWLSRSKQCLTGYKSVVKRKAAKFSGSRRNDESYVMFSFDIIKGFPLDFNIWSFLLHPLMGCKDPIKDGDKAIEDDLKEMLFDFKTHPNDYGKLEDDDILSKWSNSTGYEDFLKKHLFIENDQVVVPSLNLKSAKEIFCRNERQVKELRRMGFIKDRIKILNSKYWN